MKYWPVILLLAMMLLGCERYKPADAKPHTLVDDWHSFSSPETVRTKLASQNAACKEQFGNSLPANDKRPRFDFRTFRCSNYQHLGIKGDFELTLFNDRLMEISFSPKQDQAKEYLAAVSGREDLAGLACNQAHRLKRGSELRCYFRDDGTTLVTWTEPALSKESEDWIKQYS